MSASCPKRSTLTWFISSHIDTTRHHPTHLHLSCLLKPAQNSCNNAISSLSSLVHPFAIYTDITTSEAANIMILHAHRPHIPARGCTYRRCLGSWKYIGRVRQCKSGECKLGTWKMLKGLHDKEACVLQGVTEQEEVLSWSME